MDYQKKNPDTLVIVTADHECGGLVLGAKNVADYPEGMTPFFGAGVVSMPGSKNNFTYAPEASHTAVDVPIMATGPDAEEVTHGMMDDTQIFGLMMKGLGL